jgi:hypothetical protein
MRKVRFSLSTTFSNIKKVHPPTAHRINGLFRDVATADPKKDDIFVYLIEALLAVVVEYM